MHARTHTHTHTHSLSLLCLPVRSIRAFQYNATYATSCATYATSYATYACPGGRVGILPRICYVCHLIRYVSLSRRTGGRIATRRSLNTVPLSFFFFTFFFSRRTGGHIATRRSLAFPCSSNADASACKRALIEP
jgi:hypothetical protein